VVSRANARKHEKEKKVIEEIVAIGRFILKVL